MKTVNWHDLVFTSLLALKMNQKPSSKKSLHFPLLSLNRDYHRKSHRPTFHENLNAATWQHAIWKHTIQTHQNMWISSEWEKQPRENSLFCQANICLFDCFICWRTETLSHHVSVLRESNLTKLIISGDWARLLWPGHLSWQWMFIWIYDKKNRQARVKDTR